MLSSIAGKFRSLWSRIDSRRPLAIALALTALVTALVMISLGTWYANSQRTMRKKFHSKDVPAIGLKAALRTERIGDSVQYLFAATPISDSVRDRLNDVVRNGDRSKIKFLIALQDDAGFNLCWTKVEWHPDLGDGGKVSAISGQGGFLDCPVSRYSHAANWNLEFRYPLLTDQLSPVTDATPQSGPTAALPDASAKGETESHPQTHITSVPPLFSENDVLSGTDSYSGQIETVSGRSLRVIREAEQMTLVGWLAGDSITLMCQATDCLVTDSQRNQTIHARLVR